MAYQGERTDSPSPVMTFEVRGNWLAARVDQIDRVALAAQLWPVPLARPEHVGLFDNGHDLVPVLRLGPSDQPLKPPTEPQLVALMHVRGQTIGLAIERVGRVYARYRLEDGRLTAPDLLGAIGAQPARSSDFRFWLVDADRLFNFEAGSAMTPAPFEAT